MKILKTKFPKHLLYLLLAFFAFACQDDLVTKESPTANKEDLNYKLNDDPNARLGHNVYVLVHGAFHPESSWSEVKFLLERKGFTVKTVQLQGLGNDTTPVGSVTFQNHVDRVKALVSQQSGHVILVGHSYGGAVVSQVGEELPGKIKKLVYVSGFMPIDGEAVVQLALADTASLVTKNLIIEPTQAYLTKENYKKALYNQALISYDPFTRFQALAIISKLRPQPLATLVTPLHLTSIYGGLEKVYISSLKDRAVTPAAQHMMYSRFPETKVYTIPSSDHSPFITTPFELVEILRKL